jgi:predicted nucleotidyltransferase
LHERLGLSKASLQRDLSGLAAIGALRRVEEGRVVRYAPNIRSRFWQGVRLLLTDAPDPAIVLRDALADVPGVDAAFLFGSMATNAAVRPDSDIDVFIVETPAVDRRALHRQLVEAGMLLGREVNAVRYTPQRLAERLGDAEQAGAQFVREVLEGPKRWVLGAGEALRPLATAAGLQLLGAPDPPHPVRSQRSR